MDFKSNDNYIYNSNKKNEAQEKVKKELCEEISEEKVNIIIEFISISGSNDEKINALLFCILLT